MQGEYYPLDNFTASANVTKSYENLVAAIDITNDSTTENIVLPNGSLNITLKPGESKFLYLGGVYQFKINATGTFRCLVYGVL